MSLFKELFHGAVFGIANIIPGVSGGTMALVLGFYERLIAAIRNISPTTLLVFVGLLRFRRESLDSWSAEMKRIDAFFLVRLGIGALTAIVALAKVMTLLILEWHDPTYGFFFGLVLVSVVSPYRLIAKKSLPVLAAVLIGAVSAWGIADFASGEASIKKAQMKQDVMLSKKVQSDKTPSFANTVESNRNPLFYLRFFFMGAIAISGMILPGISGSFLLLLMGGYFEILHAIVNRNLPLLGAFAFGCLVGVLLFTRVLNYLLTTFRDATLGTLLGLVLGSLWAVWPFKHAMQVGEKTVYLHNRLPASLGWNEWTTIVSALVGMAIICLFIGLEKKR